MIKKLLLTFASILLLLLGTGFWLKSLLPPPLDMQALAQTQPQDIAYLQQRPAENRGKILAVVTSAARMGSSEKKTGYELTELARPYYVFTANGFEVDIASPKGGEPPAVIDDEDMGSFDYAFLNDEIAQEKVRNSLRLDDLQARDYQGIFFVGGKGAMFDFPQNAAIQRLVAELHKGGKVIGAVCHGPAALVNVTLDNGEPLVRNRRISGFTNQEELFLIPDAPEVFPFLLEDGLRKQGAKFEAGPLYLKQMSADGNLLTGQNPWSVWPLAESMIRTLGYEPVPRKITAEENAVEVLLAYEIQGLKAAGALLQRLEQQESNSVDRRLLALHGIVAAMRGQLIKTVDLVRLVARAKKYQGA